MHGACRAPRVVIETILGHLTRIGVVLIPGASTVWEPHISVAAVTGIIDHVSAVVEEEVTPTVIALPTDVRRSRFSMLLKGVSSGRHLAFVKLTKNTPSELAQSVLRRLGQADTSFWAPAHLTDGVVDGWHFEVTSVMPAAAHWPARLSPAQLHDLVQEIQTVLEPLSGGVGAFVLHGDFGPWNVRRLAMNGIAVIDWEEVRIGPRALDELWHMVTSFRLRSWPSPGKAEAIARALAVRYSIGDVEEAIESLSGYVVRPQREESAGTPVPAEVRERQLEYLGLLDAVRLARPSAG